MSRDLSHKDLEWLMLIRCIVSQSKPRLVPVPVQVSDITGVNQDVLRTVFIDNK